MAGADRLMFSLASWTEEVSSANWMAMLRDKGLALGDGLCAGKNLLVYGFVIVQT